MPGAKVSIFIRFKRDLKTHWFIYILVLPGVLHTLLFRVSPLYGIIVAFKDYQMMRGIIGSPWVGFKHFEKLFQTPHFFKVLGNTVIINLYNILFGFTFVIILALLLNELKVKRVKNVIQTAVYFPNFISWVIFAGIVSQLLSPSGGALNVILSFFGKDPIYFLGEAKYFRFVLVASGMVKTAGFGTIIYLASIAGISPELYESAAIDGAHRGHMIRHITLPRIKPTVAVMLIISVSNLFGSNFEQVYNLYNPLVYETGDVLSTYLFRTGLIEGKFEMASAQGLVFSLLGLLIVIFTNKIISKLDVTGFF